MMSHGFHEDRERARRRWRLVFGTARWAVLLGLLAAIGYYAYETGTALADRSNAELRAQVADQATRLQAARVERDALERDLASVTAQLAELRKRYAADVPDGAVADLVRVARAKLAGGVDPGRIGAVLAAVENARSCDEKPVNRRFLVRAGARAPAANDSAAFAERTITVTAVGEPAVDGDGRAQGWFEPAKPVTVTFTRIGGAESAKTGVLPLHHALVVNDVEHRFVVTQGDARGFVSVTADSCRYP